MKQGIVKRRIPFSMLEDVKSHAEEVMEIREIHETPASPSPPVSPDSGSQVEPIIIPTERSIDFDDKSDSKPASPDPIDTLPTKAPIIIPTERTSNDLILSPQRLCKSADDVSFTEWDMLEENENQISRNKNWQTIITSSHDVVTAAKMAGSNLSPKVNDGRSHVPMSIHLSRQIQTVQIPSLGGSRRLSSVLEKNRLMGMNMDQVSSDSRPESPVNVPDARLKSPDSETLYPKLCKKPGSKPPAPLLLSPPPVSTEPPLSMEDLAELLNDEDDSKMEKSDRLKEDLGKFKKDKQELGGTVKDAKTCKSFVLTQEDIDSESERRWEEIDKHIVKLTSRKCLPSSLNATTKADALKPGETKGPPHGSSSFTTSTSTVDGRNVPSSPSSKAEPRFADNYERHPRQLRDNQGHDKDKSNVHNVHCRLDDDMPNQMPMHHGSSTISDDRNAVLYQRRGNIEMAPRIDTEFRMEGPEYFNRQLPNQGHWPSMHAPVNANDFCNNQWPPPSNFSGMPNSPAQTYPHPMGMPHQEMWNVGTNRESIHMDPHQMNDGQMRPNQFLPNINTGIRPLMSPNTRPQDINLIPRPDDISNVDVPNVPTIQPLISPTRFPGTQYRNFQGESRPYEQPFDRGMEYPHQRQSWDSPVNRPNDVPYRPENEVPCGVMGPAESPSGPYPRPSTPCPWNRDRSGRGRNAYYNERNRAESRSNFNRDTRRSECNRFGRDGRNIFDRDPRVRTEHNLININSNQPRDNNASVRDPRLAKDKHFPSGKGKDSSFSERDPRKRLPLLPTPTTFRKVKEKPKSPPKSVDSHKRVDAENNTKQTQEKIIKDKKQSPLESLYGVIDTKAKSAQGCLQNFKIPKIKRNESSESPTSSHMSEETKECSIDKQDDKSAKKDKEDSTEVSSSCDDIPLESCNEDNVTDDKKEEQKEENISSETPGKDKTDVNIVELDSVSAVSSKSLTNVEKYKKEEIESEGSKSKDEVTQEWIETLIRKSFEFGEGKKFVEQAKFMQKLGEVLQAKKLKKIKKIIESESESSSSDKDDTPETKKVQMRKKRRVIVSDSSDEESLAERFGILKTINKELIQDTPMNDQEEDTTKVLEKEIPNIGSSEPEEKDAKDSTTQKESTIETQNTIEEKKASNEDEVNTEKEKNVPEASKNINKEESTEEKEIVSKTPKVKAKRRNSLEMLQEDIREMFISDGVVAATGHRLCRTLKENQNNAGANSSNQNIANTKKKELKKELRKELNDLAIDFDIQETVSSIFFKQKKSTRVAEEASKSKDKTKKEMQRITRQRSKQCNQSSDSEEDQPLALRTELVQNSSSLSNQEVFNDDSEILRRSKRIINKENIKEPRVVVEKADISKLECSKVMFDSSSDESFGIDVSELAAAVDISLHPDKQPESEVLEQPEKKKDTPSFPRKSTRKRRSESLNETKDNVQFTDEESITSDISMTSSTASGKKTGTSSTRMDTNANKKLLSNILVGLVSAKNEADKDSSVVDKGSDADVDDDVNDQLPTESSTKKSSTKKKKKKCNWQMGILSKKRRKKTLAASPKGDCDLNTSSELDISNKADSISESTTNKDDNSLNNTDQNISEKSEDDVKDVNSSEVLQDNSKDDNESTPVISDSAESSSSKAFANETKAQPLEVKDKEQINSNAEKSIVKNKTDIDKSFSEIDVKKLIDYVCTGQEKYKCLLCSFTGKSIVHHYKLSHSGKEILISRLKQSDALLAIQDANDNDVENSSSNPLTEKTCKFRCRFCSLFSEGATKVAMEAFYEHCTTHTGEYRFQCNSCPYQAVAKSSMRTHYYKVCRKFKDTFAEAITEDEIPDENRIYGYLCSCCNFVQLKKCNVEAHVNLWHKDDSTVKIIKINMSLDVVDDEPDEQNVDVPEEKVKIEITQSSVKEESPNEVVNLVEQTNDDISEINVIQKDKASDEKIKDKPEVKQQEENHSESEVIIDEEKKKSLQTEADSSLPSGNLSVFVCPPELEKKEVEIQLERKKKMQEIIQNIGIKLQRDASKKGLSIIDKLKDKMKTNLTTSSDESDSNVILNSPDKTLINITTSPTLSSSPTPSQNNATEVSDNSEVPSVVDSEKKETLNDKEPQKDSTSHTTQSSDVKYDSQPTFETDPTDSTTNDPLVVSDIKKNEESDIETSDNENTKDNAPIYESDFSSEQSDSELPTDVNMILKETSNMNASCKDPMLTTIQRLAAQLQATKQDETSSKPEESKRAFPFASIPKPPDVVPISNIKKFVGKKETRYHEISQDSLDDDLSKNFIRLRRLSGDMLSVPTQSSNAQEGAFLSKNIMYKYINNNTNHCLSLYKSILFVRCGPVQYSR